MTVHFDVTDHVARVTIDRPERMNAVDSATEKRLIEIWEEIERRNDIRCIVLTGAGERAFSAGADMKEENAKNGLEYWADTRPGGFGGIALRTTLDVPVIARVNGFAFGGGFEMVLGADIVIAAEDASFGLTEPRVGRLPLEGGRVPVDLQLADEDGFPHHGYIESEDNRLDSATGSLALRMVFANPHDELLPGLFARVRVPVSAPAQTVLVSERAIGTDQSQKFVLAVSDNNKLAYRTVKIGPVVDGLRVIRDGLKPGETVVVNGLQRVRPGMTVETELAADNPPTAHATAVAAQ